jgi:hypothetical protein
MRRWAWLVAAGACTAASCGDRVDGAPPVFTAGRACAGDGDCGAGRHCQEGGCALDCVKQADCDPSLACSPCGRCVAAGVLDTACLAPTERPCAADADCEKQLGDGYGCGTLGTCARRCDVATGCAERGFVCEPTRALCEERCYADGNCYFRGFARQCQLPAGVDQAANLVSETPAEGQCVARPGGVGLPALVAGAPSAAYQGVWAMLMVSAVRTDNVPVLTRIDTASIQYTLVRSRADGADVVSTVKWCSTAFKNFRDNDQNVVDLVQIVYPEHSTDSIDAVDVRATAVPGLVAGASFTSGELNDLRGARLDNPATDPLPTRLDLTHQRDQDHDGQPGMTSLSTGILTGELYQAQRTRVVFHAQAVDPDHLHGLLSTVVDTALLGASTVDLINDSTSAAHPQPDRTYFRAVRLDEAATCATVIDLAASSAWLAYDLHFDAAKRP